MMLMTAVQIESVCAPLHTPPLGWLNVGFSPSLSWPCVSDT